MKLQKLLEEWECLWPDLLLFYFFFSPGEKNLNMELCLGVKCLGIVLPALV